MEPEDVEIRDPRAVAHYLLREASKAKRKEAEDPDILPAKRLKLEKEAQQLSLASFSILQGTASAADVLRGILPLTYNMPWGDVYSIIRALDKEQAALAFRSLKEDEAYWMKRLKNEYRDYWQYMQRFPDDVFNDTTQLARTGESPLAMEPGENGSAVSFLLYQKAQKRDQHIAQNHFRVTDVTALQPVEHWDRLQFWPVQFNEADHFQLVSNEGLKFTVTTNHAFGWSAIDTFDYEIEPTVSVYRFTNAIIVIDSTEEEARVWWSGDSLADYVKGANFQHWLRGGVHEEYPWLPTVGQAFDQFFDAFEPHDYLFIGITARPHVIRPTYLKKYGIPPFATAESVIDLLRQVWTQVPEPVLRHTLQLGDDVDLDRPITVLQDGIVFHQKGRDYARILMYETGRRLRIPALTDLPDTRYIRVFDIGKPYEPVVVVYSGNPSNQRFLTHPSLEPGGAFFCQSFSNGWMSYNRTVDNEAKIFVCNLRRKLEGLSPYELELDVFRFLVNADAVVGIFYDHESDNVLHIKPMQLSPNVELELIEGQCVHCSMPAEKVCSRCQRIYCTIACQHIDHQAICHK